MSTDSLVERPFVTGRIPLDTGGAVAERQQQHVQKQQHERQMQQEQLRRHVEDSLLRRERTIASLNSWLLALYRVQSKLGSKYGGSASMPSLRSWQTLSSTTREDHLVKLALLIAALRMHTCELVEALAAWRAAQPKLQVITSSGQEVELDRPFTWRGRWWPLQLCLDPPSLPLPLPCDPLLLRWFDRAVEDGGTGGGGGGGLAYLWASGDPAAAPLGLFAPAAWHPPPLLDRMAAADALLARELAMLDLRPAAMLRARHAAPPPPSAPPTPATPGGAAAAPKAVWSSVAPWTQDGAAAQMAALLYGGVKPFTLAVKALTKQVDAAEAEFARQNAAAVTMQRVMRGRSDRIALGKRRKQPRGKKSFQAPTAADGKNAGVGLNKHQLRTEAAGHYAGTAMRLDHAQREKDLKEGASKERSEADVAAAEEQRTEQLAAEAEAAAAAATTRAKELLAVLDRTHPDVSCPPPSTHRPI